MYVYLFVAVTRMSQQNKPTWLGTHYKWTIYGHNTLYYKVRSKLVWCHITMNFIYVGRLCYRCEPWQ